MPGFTEDFYKNRLFTDTMYSYDYPAEEKTGVPNDVGVEYRGNGDIILRLWAPEAKKVEMKSWDRDFPVVKEGGMFTATLKYDETATGPRYFNIYMDGTEVLYPYFPIYWTGNRPTNYVEVPDEEFGFCMTGDVPHGALIREIYWAECMGNFERCLVYTPPGYMNGTEEYPVLYLQNGGSDNEMCWEYSGRMSQTMDNLIASGEAKPFIVVMNNTQLRLGGRTANLRDLGYERMLIESCIPYIEKTYRVKKDKWNRAIGGLSMGAYMSNDIGLRHPELFGSIGGFTASMTTTENRELYERPYPSVIAAAKEDISAFADDYRLFFRSTTRQENHFEFFEADDRLCEESGIAALDCYHRIVYEDRTSKWSSWRQGYRDFAKLLFR